MIVKNEEPCIARCLRSIAPYIQHFVICDTGSKDKTVDIIHQTAKELNLPGEVYQDEWVNFSHNRNLSLKRCEGKSDYVFIIDCDEIVTNASVFPLTDDSVDVYYGQNETSTMTYEKPRLIKNDGNWTWRHPVHEYLSCNKPHPNVRKTNLTLKDLGDGGRNRSGVKFYNDLIILETEHLKNPDDERTVFYLARTFEDIGSWHKAIEMYKKRVNLKRWDQEVYYSLWKIAELKFKINNNIFECIDAFMQAYTYRPQRLEALVSLCEKLREEKCWATIYHLSKDKSERNADVLFVRKDVEWRIIEEHGLACYYLGRKDEAKHAFRHVLAHFELGTQRERVMNSLSFC